MRVRDSSFGAWVEFPDLDRSGLILISVLTRHGLKPVKVLLPHQLYLQDIRALQAEGDVVVTTIPVAREHLNVSAFLRGDETVASDLVVTPEPRSP